MKNKRPKQSLINIKDLKNIPKPEDLAISIDSVIPSFNHILGAASINNLEAKEFSQKVAKLSVSDDVLNELVTTLDIPNPNESEDEFVERGKAILTQILRQKLSIK